MAATDISLVNNVTEITVEGYNARAYSGYAAQYAFNERDELQLTINGAIYVVPLADLTVNGSTVATVEAAMTALSSAFPSEGEGGGLQSIVAGDGIDVDDADPENPVVSATSGGAPAYLVYTALLTQSGTDAPVATVLANTLGGTPNWQYEGVGEFPVYLADAWVTNKTAVFLPVVAGFVEAVLVNTGEIKLIMYNDSFGSSNDLLTKSVIEIRVYP